MMSLQEPKKSIYENENFQVLTQVSVKLVAVDTE